VASLLKVGTATLSKWECDKIHFWALTRSPIQPSEGTKATNPKALPFCYQKALKIWEKLQSSPASK
jgi:hypothetical protein